MQLKRLGDSLVQVSEIGLGTWDYRGGTGPLRAGIAHGASFIDTAEIYGTEEVVGQAIRDCRHRVFVATKVAPRNFRKKDLIAAAERSLRRLGTDYIDLYQLHWPNYTVPIEESMTAMEELIDRGKIRFIGVSNFSVRELRKAQAALTKHKIVSNQVRYSLIDRTIEGDLLEYCQKAEIAVIAYSPLGKNFSVMRANDPQGTMARVASVCRKTEVQVALNWLIARNKVIAIPKASTVAHAVENCGASDWSLSEAEHSLLEETIRCERCGRVESTLRNWKRHVVQVLGRQI